MKRAALSNKTQSSFGHVQAKGTICTIMDIPGLITLTVTLLLMWTSNNRGRVQTLEELLYWKKVHARLNQINEEVCAFTSLVQQDIVWLDIPREDGKSNMSKKKCSFYLVDTSLKHYCLYLKANIMKMEDINMHLFLLESIEKAEKSFWYEKFPFTYHFIYFFLLH